ncbi:MAG: hypothetical protein Q7S52_05805, partial [bacterium]|nr:hypothetical protein [bacterium]
LTEIKNKSQTIVTAVVVVLGFVVPGLVFAQYDYYDPYSNSNIDYYPMNPVSTYSSPSGSTDSGTSDTSTVTTSGGTTGTTGTTNTTTYCANKPLVNPQNTRSVEIRDKGGKVFYSSLPQEELVGIRAYPETTTSIYKIIYGSTGMQVDEKEIGLITVSNNCYPKYGYVEGESTVTTSVTSPTVSSVTNTQTVDSTTVPDDATAVKLDPATGKVYNAKTGELITQARYDAALRKIFYKDTDSTYGKVFTDTTGYVNLDLRGMVNTYTAPSASPIVQYNETNLDFIKRTSPSSGSIGDVDRDGTLDKTTPSAPSSINEGNNENWDFDGKNTLTTSGQKSGESIGDPDFDLLHVNIGDPDFDLLNINIGGDDLEKFRADVSNGDQANKVTVRGWDPEKKEEIVGKPEAVKTFEDLQVYIEAVALNDAAITGIEIRQGILELESREQGKLFGFIPIEMSSSVVVKFTLEDSTEDPVDVKFPWWHIFVKKSYSPSVLEGELRADTTGAFDPSKWEKIDNSEAPTDASRVARALGFISNIMKTKHDTVKNSIGNVR